MFSQYIEVIIMTGGTKSGLACVLVLNHIAIHVVVMLNIIKFFLDPSRCGPIYL